MRKTYGDNFPMAWLKPQLYDLCEYTNSRGKMDEQQITMLAGIITNEYYYLKASELLLFFYKFKAGRYGRFYGNVDPMVITIALGEFRRERAAVYDRHEAEEREKERTKWKQGAVKPEQMAVALGLPPTASVAEIAQHRWAILEMVDFVCNLADISLKIVGMMQK